MSLGKKSESCLDIWRIVISITDVKVIPFYGLIMICDLTWSLSADDENFVLRQFMSII